MRRPSPQRVRASRAGCLGGLIGLMAGAVLSYPVYLATEAVYLSLLMVALGALAGAQVGQRLAARRGRVRRRRG